MYNTCLQEALTGDGLNPILILLGLTLASVPRSQVGPGRLNSSSAGDPRARLNAAESGTVDEAFVSSASQFRGTGTYSPLTGGSRR